MRIRGRIFNNAKNKDFKICFLQTCKLKLLCGRIKFSAFKTAAQTLNHWPAITLIFHFVSFNVITPWFSISLNLKFIAFQS